ncbi:MAG: DNA polymerase III subunit [Acidobacteria bacterium]|nr:DNA polymerase III subunit [Acidobacteriota bacterium]
MKTPRQAVVEAAAKGVLHHAVILHGPSSRELRETAFEVARAACCRGGGDDDCTSCSRVERGIHPDVHHVIIEEGRKWISIEQVRGIVAEAGMKPYESSSKVFIIDPIDGVTTQGANALLKTLEEPPGESLFLLLTRMPDKLLPTIRSRAQAVAIRPAGGPVGSELARAEGIDLAEARLRSMALSSEEADEDVALAKEIARCLESWASERDTAALLELSAIISATDDPARAATVYAATLRDIVATAGNETRGGSAELIRSRIADHLIVESARASLEAIERFTVNVDPRLTFDGVVLELIPRR